MPSACCHPDRPWPIGQRLAPWAGRAALALGTLVLGLSAGAQEFMAGADISALAVHENAGAVYSDDAGPGDAIEILSGQGTNWYRLRLFVDPGNDSNPFVAQDTEYVIDLAKRVKAAGGKVLLDFHYSDTWADPGKQYLPAAWESFSFDELEQAVYGYTRDTIQAFAAEGVTPEMVQLGNEISNGMLWPHGKLGGGGAYGSQSSRYDRLAALLTAGAQGARAGAGARTAPEIMIHHAPQRGNLWGSASGFFDELVARELDFDVIGHSYYPKWHYDPDDGDGGLDDIAENLNNSADAYGKPVVVVETGFASRGAQWEPDYEFEVSETGQAEFLESLVDIVRDVPDGLGRGVFWWYAEATPTFGLSVWEGGRYGLFDDDGRVLPAAAVYQQFLSPTLAGDLTGDGIVNAVDYTLWRDGLGDTYSGQDYLAWREGFGAAVESAGAGETAPEPISIAILVGAAAITAPARIARGSSVRPCTAGSARAAQ